MSKSPEEGSVTRRGEASERILHALASEFPKMHNRESFLSSPSLLERFNKKPGEKLTDHEARAVAKTLGRLIGDKGDPNSRAVSEILWLRGKDDRVGLPESGLVAVSVDIASLREEEWLRLNIPEDELESLAKLRGPLLPPERSPTQEGLVEEILAKSRDWARQNTSHGHMPILLTNVSIVHGSNAFDMLINISMKTEEILLRYTREVVQRIPHVRGTQTMLIAEGYGFSDVSDSIRRALAS
jgi:hypothetical protein